MGDTSGTLTTVEPGEELAIKEGTWTIGEPCGESAGMWYCVTHDKILPNNLEKDWHIREGDHRMAWWCVSHGPEKP